MEQMLQMEGLGSCCLNKKVKRGGGVAIIYDTESIDMSEVDIVVPNNLEIIWRLGRPKKGQIKNIIFTAFYYPPKARKQQKLINHMLETTHLLLSSSRDSDRW